MHKTKTFTMAVLDRNGISTAQQTAEAANLTITGALATGGVATLDVPRHIGIYCAGDINTVTFTVYGTDRYGNSITETITGVNATTVNGTKNFKTVTQVAADAAVGTNVEVGSTNQADTAIYAVSYRAPSTTYQVELSASAGLTWAFEYTTRDVLGISLPEDSITWFTDLSAQTGNADNVTEGSITACRLAITNWTSASDTVYLTITQGEYR